LSIALHDKYLSRNHEFLQSKGGHKMSKIIKELVELFAKQPTTLEMFVNSKEPKTHADVEYWSKYFEYRGL
jgi:spore coat polysaccharide biosynthesis predicted glycosyltransferase SpsG